MWSRGVDAGDEAGEVRVDETGEVRVDETGEVRVDEVAELILHDLSSIDIRASGVDANTVDKSNRRIFIGYQIMNRTIIIIIMHGWRLTRKCRGGN